MSAINRQLSVVMPVYNEAQGLVAAVREVHASLTQRGFTLELIVVDDASTDQTHELASGLCAELSGVRVLRHAKNLGPCSGLATGGRAALHDWVLLLPADIAIPLEDVDLLWSARERGDVVVGFLAEPAARDRRRQLQSWVYTQLVNALFGLGVRQVNYVTLYHRRVFSHDLTTAGVARHAELLVRARKAGLRLTQVALGYRPRTTGAATGSRPAVILKTVWELLKLRASV